MIDHELGADMRALLAAGRDHLGPDAATVARLRSRIDAAVAPAAAAPASAAKALGIKLTLVAVTAAVSAGVYRYIDERREVAAPSALPIGAGDELLDIEMRSALASHEPPPPAPQRTAERAPEPPLQVAMADVAPAVAAPPVETGISLAREIELVDRAALGLRRRDLDAALQALRSYADEAQGRGQLAQDAAAIEVEVLCRKHDSKAAAQLAAFEQRWPSSAHNSHLRVTCEEKP